ncbi:hypothetical protein [Sagittula salina]|uniref:hypothetical protein n=1 Tax=Sagittula salina TaxID=2820268 RepID=UPI001FD79D42|nr:hypothetical protein [Sagittula salina]
MRGAAGNLRPGATATGCTGVGRAEPAVDNTGGAAGAVTANWRPGVFLARTHGADAVDAADGDGLCQLVEDQTVAASDGTGARSPARIVDALAAEGVWVRVDGAPARAV